MATLRCPQVSLRPHRLQCGGGPPFGGWSDIDAPGAGDGHRRRTDRHNNLLRSKKLQPAPIEDVPQKRLQASQRAHGRGPRLDLPAGLQGTPQAPEWRSRNTFGLVLVADRSQSSDQWGDGHFNTVRPPIGANSLIVVSHSRSRKRGCRWHATRRPWLNFSGIGVKPAPSRGIKPAAVQISLPS
jgi:hypothetical protein